MNKNRDLLKGWIGTFMRSKWYPGVFTWPAMIIFGVIIYQTLWGPNSAHDNFGSAMTWVLWWPIIPIVFILLGRFWCAVCPFATISDFVQKYFGANLPVPRFLRKYGIWIIDALFILITWADHVYGIVGSPRGSGYLLMLLFTGVVVTGIFFERRAWCRHLCFLGGLSGNYSRAGMLELRATPDKCKTCTTQSCYKGGEQAPGCPMFEFPKTMDTSAQCNLCGYCVKNCPNDSITLKTRKPTKELWNIRKPHLQEAFLAIIIMGIVFVQNITMLDIWPTMLTALEGFTGTTSYYVNFTIAFMIAMSLPVLIMLIPAAIASKAVQEGIWKNLARFGYAIIPLDLAGHIAHNLFHLLAEGLAIVYTGLAMFGIEIEGSPAILDTAVIQVMQYGLVVLGTVASIYAVYRIAKSSYPEGTSTNKLVIPYAVIMVFLGIINFVLFYLPMAHRM
ncbi:ferredoxin [Desulfuribacillus stibiiarsenatis]|uniref:Ferredoxin n=1 Tax=Desulfuribacillus stibiiarsenatis TaxID=1390249 RepID=A0A1E5L8Z5_9FIRM|nr:4Fe-4S binding protein [Desulfuribacillus stibiiarsenatis]OEH86601.1 ferredoxin [Desulfuribacillus stibiiarsenatis]